MSHLTSSVLIFQQQLRKKKSWIRFDNTIHNYNYEWCMYTYLIIRAHINVVLI